MNPEVDIYISQLNKWQEESKLLRAILLECDLTEVIKWGKPCYTYNEKNIVILQSFKDHCDLGFFNGALLKDKKSLLKKAGENTQAPRQMRFTALKEIKNMRGDILTYIKEAIKIEQAGIKFIPEEKRDHFIPEELHEQFKKDPTLQKAFYSLTPGRQRGYLIYFTSAKQTETRNIRINKYRERILCGKGLNDCTCGLSKKMPQCDGSHKFL